MKKMYFGIGTAMLAIVFILIITPSCQKIEPNIIIGDTNTNPGTGGDVSSSNSALCITSPTHNTAFNTANIDVTGKAFNWTGAGLEGVYLAVGADSAQKVANNGIWEWETNITFSVEGAYEIRAKANDLGGTISDEVKITNIMIDWTSPVAGFSVITNGESLSGDVAVTITNSDALSGVAELTILANGAAFTNITSPSGSQEIVLGTLSDDITNLSVFAEDNAGNVSATNTIDVTIITTWETVLSWTGQDKAYDFVMDDEGNSYISGFRNGRIYVVKLDENGIEQVSTLFPSVDFDDYFWGKSIKMFANGDLGIACSFVTNGNTNFAFMVLETNDLTISFKTNYDSIGRQDAFDFDFTDDGGIVISGVTRTGATDNWYLLKTDSQFDIDWERTIAPAPTVSPIIAHSVIQANDTFIYSAGVFYSSDNLGKIVKLTNTSGSISTQQSMGSADSGYYDIIENTSGNLIVCGNNGSNKWVVEYSKSFLVLHDVSINSGYFYETFRSIKETSDGGYIACGYVIETDGSDEDLYLVKYDSDLDIEWEMIHDNNGNYDRGYSVKQTLDKGFIVVGSTREGTDDNWWILKTDDEGQVY